MNEMQNENQHPKMLRWDEAMELLRSVDDSITNQLMNRANFEIIKKFSERRGLPVADFDLRFFMEVMLEFCGQHTVIKKILDGEDLRPWTEDNL
jgi:hypothetical protein